MSFSKVRIGGALAALTLVLIQAADAAESQPIKFNAADQAAAKAMTLKRSDLGAAWKGGATKPDLSNDTCPTKRSDLVLTGAAKSEFNQSGLFVTSESAVLQSPAMVRADWQRTAANPRLAQANCISKARAALGAVPRSLRLRHVRERRTPPDRHHSGRSGSK